MRTVFFVVLMVLGLAAASHAGKGTITKRYATQLVRSAASQQLGGSPQRWRVKLRPSTVPKWTRYEATKKGTHTVMTGAIFVGKGENALIRGRTRVIRDAAPVSGKQFRP